MKIVKESQKITVRPTGTTTIHEYDTQDESMSGAIAEIQGRYPTEGFALNQKVKEIVYVLEGQGLILTPTGQKELSKGDIVFVDRDEKFAWSGNMTLFMVTAPRFDPDQHVIL